MRLLFRISSSTPTESSTRTRSSLFTSPSRLAPTTIPTLIGRMKTLSRQSIVTTACNSKKAQPRGSLFRIERPSWQSSKAWVASLLSPSKSPRHAWLIDRNSLSLTTSCAASTQLRVKSNTMVMMIISPCLQRLVGVLLLIYRPGYAIRMLKRPILAILRLKKRLVKSCWRTVKFSNTPMAVNASAAGAASAASRN